MQIRKTVKKTWNHLILNINKIYADLSDFEIALYLTKLAKEILIFNWTLLKMSKTNILITIMSFLRKQ